MEVSIAVNSKLDQTKELFLKTMREVEDEEKESGEIKKRLYEIDERIKALDENIAVMSHKKECLDVLLDEIDIGYDKIVASSQCLSVLATRKLRMLRRKYNKYI